jgi:hypothetical protein
MRVSTLPLFSSLLITSLTLCSCDKDKNPVSPDSSNELIFGQFYGECFGERCIDIYKLDGRSKELLEDTRDAYPSASEPYDGDYAAVDASFYPYAEDLAQYIPEQLLRQANGPVGQPDAGDWGGYYLEVSENGKRRFWLIDTQKSNLPTYLHPLADTLRARIDRLP